MPTMATSGQSPAGNHQHSQPTNHGPASPSSSPQRATFVNTAPVISERPSVKLKVVGGKSDILNSVVVNTAGQSLYSISSDPKRTTMVACKDSVEVATVNWNRSSPRMVFRRKKMKCKDWLPLTGPETESRMLTHGDSQLIWMNKSSTSGYLIPANRPGLSVARWRISPRSDDLYLEVFQEALVESGLLEAIVVSIVLLRSGESLNDSMETMTSTDQRFYIETKYHL